MGRDRKGLDPIGFVGCGEEHGFSLDGTGKTLEAFKWEKQYDD